MTGISRRFSEFHMENYGIER